MPSLNSALNMGSRAMSASQRAVTTAGHNIANQNTEGFSRQQQSTQTAFPQPNGIGNGTEPSPTTRVFDRFVQRKIVQETPRSGVFTTREEFFSKLELVFSEMSDSGLHRAMNDFWNSWSQLANQPESDVVRTRVRDQGDTLATRFRERHAQLQSLRKEADARIQGAVNQINNLAQQVKELNRQIYSYEISGHQANDARDARELAVEKLSKLVDVNMIENSNGRTSVIIGRDWTLVEGDQVFELDATLRGGEAGMVSIDGIATHDHRRDLTRSFRGGQMTELIQMRDETIVGYMNQLDELAFGVAAKVNQPHATGTGISSATDLMKSAYALTPEARAQPMPFLQDGVFQLHLVDRDNSILETYEIEVQAGVDSLEDIVKRINQTVNDPNLLAASIGEDGSMFLESGQPRRFIFGDDQTAITQVMGFNSFFETLKGAADLRISPRILEDPNAISTGRDLIPGDNQVALAIAKLQNQPTMRDETVTFGEYYNSILGDIGLKVQRNQVEKAQQDNMVQQFREIRSSISAVNMDEELADMIQHQKAYEASARYVSTVDEMMQTLINM
ncbi:MAG: flagellar hook-associated protein FlgK [SAR324 cluster bacterium]|jgi:flagellar hook-associated protein 1 FlgK|nr:flagellar hook-associated protein FlgK [SAR324 cluster bacterium]HIF70071.1 flagellar hook-associated protein FlgK [Candidatus Lambdaproteobacteria bacterium]HIL16398.1 flagellar hook-associated protein FlgK [Deltaproteobacteria bacterium]|tara:strand:- start:5363 stop:7051 length:1689 start_codon:yes stop_codon:yes gene_type:complete